MKKRRLKLSYLQPDQLSSFSNIRIEPHNKSSRLISHPAWMKKLFTTFTLLCILIIVKAQPVLYGLTSGNSGTISKYETATNTLSTAFKFSDDGRNPQYENLIQATNGKLYGMAAYWGSSYGGVIFSFDPATSVYTKVKDFDGTNGARPHGSLIQGKDGKLYGMTVDGGSSGEYGVIFSFDPATSTLAKVKAFDGTNGSKPFGSLLQASDGNLYGITSQGGSSDAGVIFSFDPAVDS